MYSRIYRLGRNFMLKKVRVKICLILALMYIGTGLPVFAQGFVEDYTMFGQNKVQYKNFVWYYLQTEHFDVYFYEDGEKLAEFTAEVAEASLTALENSLQYRIKERVPLVVYKSHNDFQQTNVIQEYMEEGIGGVTESFKNRVVIPFEGDYAQYRHVVHHELTHAFMNDMMFGGGVTNAVLSQARYNIPLWFAEGLAEYESMGWDTRSDMMVRDAAISGYLKPEYLDYFAAYWGGQSIFNFVKDKYGEEKIGELVRKVKQTKDVNKALKSSIGMDLEEMLKKWQLHIKRTYWPDIKNRQKPEELSKAMTDHEKLKNFFNISPSISPNGDKIAFISDRDGYADVFIMSAIDGKILKKVISGQKSPQFEELHWLSPGISWSPDGKYIALAAKGKGAHDILYTVEVESEKIKSFDFDLDGAFGSSWSPKGDEIVFIGNKAQQSDIYAYNVSTGKLRQITNDVFTDTQPVWSPDGKKIAFVSDRGDYTDPGRLPKNFKMQNFSYKQRDLYVVDADGSNMVRLTNTPYDEEWPAWAPDGEALAITAEQTGISNIFLLDLKTKEIRPLTNAITGCFQLTWSRDGSKMVFSSFSNAGWDVYMIKNPLDIRSEDIKLENTVFFDKLKEQMKREEERAKPAVIAAQISDSTVSAKSDYSRYVFDKDLRDRSNKPQEAGKSKTEPESKNTYKTPEGEYLVKKYKLRFTPDLVMGNAGYSTYFGVQGQSALLLSDVLGNHQIVISTDLYFDLKNSSYYGQYLYLPRKTDYGFNVYHMAQFFYDYGGSFGMPVEIPYRVRNYGFNFMLSRPFSKFSRVEMSLGYENASQTFLDDYSSYFPELSINIFRPSISIIKDNTLWTQGNWGPIDGTRVNLTFTASPRLGKNSYSFNTVMLDYRRYHKIRKDYSFDWRVNTGASFGSEPETFFVGGVANWFNYKYKGQIRDQLRDIFFSYWITPLRGSPYWSLVGNRFSLVNMEFRFPFLQYLVLGWPLPIGFQNLRGTFFWDIGAAWNNSDFKLKEKNSFDGKDRYRDVATGYGVGVAIPFYFLIRFNMAWTYDGLGNSKPHYLFSMGYDF